MTWIGEAAKRSTFRYIDPEVLDAASTISTEACPGEGRCHGCMSWCDDCGDVDKVCHALYCDRHRCVVCNEIAVPFDREDYTYTCVSCEWHALDLKPEGGSNARTDDRR